MALLRTRTATVPWIDGRVICSPYGHSTIDDSWHHVSVTAIGEVDDAIRVLDRGYTAYSRFSAKNEPTVVSLDWLEDRGGEVGWDHSAREFDHIADLDGLIDAYQQMHTP